MNCVILVAGTDGVLRTHGSLRLAFGPRRMETRRTKGLLTARFGGLVRKRYTAKPGWVAKLWTDVIFQPCSSVTA